MTSREDGGQRRKMRDGRGTIHEKAFKKGGGDPLTGTDVSPGKRRKIWQRPG
jgi:hypothetical protein